MSSRYTNSIPIPLRDGPRRQRSYKSENLRRLSTLAHSNTLDFEVFLNDQNISYMEQMITCMKQLNDFYSEQDKLTGMKILMNNMFPNFPDSMLQVLILREDGNTKNTAKSLIKRGWKPQRKHLKSLHKNPCPLLQIPYYWGTWKTEYIQKLKRKPNGTYITCVVKSKPTICFVKDKQIFMQQILYPSVNTDCIIKFNLSSPLKRLDSISLIDLIPRISNPIIVKSNTSYMWNIV